jgi:glycosyltransferase involved in cell wall biosynthesis
MYKVVSIITPCYNGSKFVHRLLDSVLMQTYLCIEMFVIDDGSTDSTAAIIKSYIPKFESKGYSLIYLYQENSGQSVAVNKGLKLFTGDYLTWPDSDDFYATNDAIEKMAQVLMESNENIGVVRSSVKLLDENTVQQIGVLGKNVSDKQEVNFFEDALLARSNFWFQPISYMVKTECVIELIKDRDIYTQKDAGQNWQIFLPIFYKYNCCLLDSFLCNVLVRLNSHSKGSYNSYEKIKGRNLSYEQTIINTLNRMFFLPTEVKEKYIKVVEDKYFRAKFEFAKKKYKSESLKEIYKKEEKAFAHLITEQDKTFYLISHVPFLFKLVVIIVKIVNKLKRIMTKFKSKNNILMFFSGCP